MPATVVPAAQVNVVIVVRLWDDIQVLEATLRIFLTETSPSKNYITNQHAFGELVVEYNGQLSKAERSLYSVDTTIIHIRNALAHGLSGLPTNSAA